MSTIRMVIRTSGAVELLQGPVAIERILRLIGATILDTVPLRHLGDPLHVMCVDDEGYETEAIDIEGGVYLKPVRARKPFNVKATALYHLNMPAGTTHQIVGDVVVLPDQDFARE